MVIVAKPLVNTSSIAARVWWRPPRHILISYNKMAAARKRTWTCDARLKQSISYPCDGDGFRRHNADCHISTDHSLKEIIT